MATQEDVETAYREAETRASDRWLDLNRVHVVLGKALGLRPLTEQESPKVKFYPRYEVPGGDGSEFEIDALLRLVEGRLR